MDETNNQIGGKPGRREQVVGAADPKMQGVQSVGVSHAFLDTASLGPKGIQWGDTF